MWLVLLVANSSQRSSHQAACVVQDDAVRTGGGRWLCHMFPWGSLFYIILGKKASFRVLFLLFSQWKLLQQHRRKDSDSPLSVC